MQPVQNHRGIKEVILLFHWSKIPLRIKTGLLTWVCITSTRLYFDINPNPTLAGLHGCFLNAGIPAEKLFTPFPLPAVMFIWSVSAKNSCNRRQNNNRYIVKEETTSFESQNVHELTNFTAIIWDIWSNNIWKVQKSHTFKLLYLSSS